MYERELVYEAKVAKYESEYSDNDLEDYIWSNV
jgi:hypothetical protein